MPHYPKPLLGAFRNTWFVEIDGWDPPREILEACHREMARRGQPQTLSINLGQGSAVVEVLDSFLDWLQKRVQEGQ